MHPKCVIVQGLGTPGSALLCPLRSEGFPFKFRTRVMVLMSLGLGTFYCKSVSFLSYSFQVLLKSNVGIWAPLAGNRIVGWGQKNCTGTTFENLSSSSSPSVRPLILLLGTA